MKDLLSFIRSSIGTALVCLSLGVASCAKSPPPEKPSGIAPSAPGPPAPSAPAPSAAPTAATPPAPSAAPEPMESPPDPKQTVSGKIVLPAARKSDVEKGDTLFIIARRAGGIPGPPLAVQRLQAGDFPMPFSLSARDAMVPGVPFEGDISITVRVDKDGDAMTRRKGDVFGQLLKVKVGTQAVRIALDTVQAEDVTLGGGPMGAQRQGLPPGHP